ncbi:MAG TPA: radical SAM protein [Atribacteraceae bacterium]|nr:radical SAM protein [Atribacteraceae bacterium]
MNFQWHLTNRCNLRCLHCYQSEFQDPASVDLLALASRLLSDLEARGASGVINITGGEPLMLAEELYRLLAVLETARPVTELMIITNGLLLDRESIDRLAAFSKLSTIKISLEGASSRSNDRIRGRGVFRKALEALRRTRDSGRFQVIVMNTLTPDNIDEVVPLLELVEEESFHGLIIERFIPEGQGRNLRDGILSPAEWRDFVTTLVECCDMDSSLADLAPYRAFWIRPGQGDREILGAACNLGESFCIMPEGTLLPCRRFLYPLGNLIGESLWDIVGRSPLLEEVRDRNRLQGKCRTCRHESCYGCRALGYACYRDPFAEDFLCFEK